MWAGIITSTLVLLCVTSAPSTRTLPATRAPYGGWNETQIETYIRENREEIMAAQRARYATFEERRELLRKQGLWPHETGTATLAQADGLCQELYYDWGNPEQNFSWQKQTIQTIEGSANEGNRSRLRDCLVDYRYALGNGDLRLLISLGAAIDHCADIADEEALSISDELLEDAERQAAELDRPAYGRLARTVRSAMENRRERFRGAVPSIAETSSSQPAVTGSPSPNIAELKRLLDQLSERGADALPLLQQIRVVHLELLDSAAEQKGRIHVWSSRVFRAYERVLQRITPNESVYGELSAQLEAFARRGYVAHDAAGVAWLRCVAALGPNAKPALKDVLRALIERESDAGWKNRLIEASAANGESPE